MSSPISKTAFIKAEQCLKHFYLYKNHPYLRDSLSRDKQFIFKRGTDVGIFAQQLFPDGIDVTLSEKRDQVLFAQKTIDLIASGVSTIYEATFIYNDLLTNLIKSNADTYAFLNNWCYNEDIPNINTIKLPNTFKKNKNILEYKDRNKCIFKTDSIYLMDGVHYNECYIVSNPIIETNNVMFHFSNWTQKGRINGNADEYSDVSTDCRSSNSKLHPCSFKT